MSEETKTAGFDEALWLVNMLLDQDADRLSDLDEDEQVQDEKKNLLAFREVVRRVETQAKRIEELEDVLRSAHCIAERRGFDTAWNLFAARIAGLGIGSVTAKVFKNSFDMRPGGWEFANGSK